MHRVAFALYPTGAADGRLQRQYAEVIEIDPRPRGGHFHIAQPVNGRPGGDVVGHQRVSGVFIQAHRHRPRIAEPAVLNDPFIVIQPQRQRAVERAGNGELLHFNGAN